MRRGAAALLATVGGLLMAGGSTGNWVVETVRTDLGGVARTDEVVTPGVELAGALLPLGVVAVAGGLAAFVVTGRLRRTLGVLLVLLGLAALVVAGFGVAEAANLDGDIGTAAFVAALGALSVAVAGVLALRPAGPARLPARYELDEDDDPDAEWREAVAADEEGEEAR